MRVGQLKKLLDKAHDDDLVMISTSDHEYRHVHSANITQALTSKREASRSERPNAIKSAHVSEDHYGDLQDDDHRITIFQIN